jgi:anion-transporting  ArsA/GET3 family ATPase
LEGGQRQPLMAHLLDKRFVVVAGKGGVGRTTVALILGRCAERRGRRTLVCLTNAPLRYADLLGGVTLGPEPLPVSDLLHVINLEPRAAREEYGLMVLKNRTLHRLVFGSRVVQAFLDAVPGLAEWAMLGKATFHAMAEVDGRPQYDLVVFDSPATGHGLNVLALPRAIVTAIPAGRMREEAAERVTLMSDPDCSEILPVTIPEELPVNETAELVRGLERLGLPVARLVVNMVEASGLPAELERLVEREGGGEDAPSWLLPVAAAVGRRRFQEHALGRLDEDVPLAQLRLPLIAGEGLDERSVLELSRRFEQELERARP